MSPAVVDKLRSRFDALDTEHTGLLDREQLLSMFEKDAAVSGDMVYDLMQREEDGAHFLAFLVSKFFKFTLILSPLDHNFTPISPLKFLFIVFLSSS